MANENWKLKIDAQRKLKRKGALLIRERVGLLIEIEQDEEFFAFCNENASSTIEELDKELDDVGFDFLTMKKVYETITDPKQWERTSLRMLVAEVLGKKKIDRTKEGISWKERALKSEKECERLRADNMVLTARVTELEKVIRLLAGERKLAEVS